MRASRMLFKASFIQKIVLAIILASPSSVLAQALAPVPGLTQFEDQTKFSLESLIPKPSELKGGFEANQRTCHDQGGQAHVLSPGPQDYKIGVPFREGNYLFTPVIFGDLAGNFGKLFMIYIRDMQLNCTIAVVSAGSFNKATKTARALDEITANERMYHIDHYITGDHRQLELNTIAPTFQSLKSRALKLYQ